MVFSHLESAVFSCPLSHLDLLTSIQHPATQIIHLSHCSNSVIVLHTLLHWWCAISAILHPYLWSILTFIAFSPSSICSPSQPSPSYCDYYGSEEMERERPEGLIGHALPLQKNKKTKTRCCNLADLRATVSLPTHIVSNPRGLKQLADLYMFASITLNFVNCPWSWTIHCKPC